MINVMRRASDNGEHPSDTEGREASKCDEAN